MAACAWSSSGLDVLPLAGLRDVYFGHAFQSVDFFAVILIAFSLSTVIFGAITAIRTPGQFRRLRRHLSTVLAINVTTALAWTCYFYSLTHLEPAIVNTVHSGMGPLTVIALAAGGVRLAKPGVAAPRRALRLCRHRAVDRRALVGRPGGTFRPAGRRPRHQSHRPRAADDQRIVDHGEPALLQAPARSRHQRGSGHHGALPAADPAGRMRGSLAMAGCAASAVSSTLRRSRWRQPRSSSCRCSCCRSASRRPRRSPPTSSARWGRSACSPCSRSTGGSPIPRRRSICILAYSAAAIASNLAHGWRDEQPATAAAGGNIDEAAAKGIADRRGGPIDHGRAGRKVRSRSSSRTPRPIHPWQAHPSPHCPRTAPSCRASASAPPPSAIAARSSRPRSSSAIATSTPPGNTAPSAGSARACARPAFARSEIFLTTKVSHEYLRTDDFARSVDESLKNLGVDFVDLLLVHWPNPDIPLAQPMAALAKAKRQGLARHIGVANFNIALLDEAIRLCPEPLVNLQAEYHPYLDQTQAHGGVPPARHHLHGLLPARPRPDVARPGARRHRRPQGTAARPDRAALARPAGQHHSDPALIQSGRMAENLDVFDFALTEDEMKRIAALARARRPDRQSRRPRAGVGLMHGQTMMPRRPNTSCTSPATTAGRRRS